jgi:type I restriction enzyme S subunit
LLVEGALDLNLMDLTANGITSDFLWWWIQRLDLTSRSNGSNVPQINNGDVSPLEIEVPPPAEQAEIARQLEVGFAWIDRLASDATSARKLIDHLDQAVFAKAFRGELVPQDPADEPASVLLERIKATRSLTPVRRGRRRDR